MKTSLYFIAFLILGIKASWAQVVLSANGPGNTYEEINAVLAPGYDVVEVPDCVHTDFGRHIDEVFDKTLNTHVFRFISHVNIDNDRCKRDDKQRVEIKSYGQSPDILLAIEGETVEYKWKFKLPSNFDVSKSFTHLHQIKSVGGPYESIPMVTLTARKGNSGKPDRFELRYTSTKDQTTMKTLDLDLLKGSWVEATEVITFGNKGSYYIEIKKVSNGSTLFLYEDSLKDMWQDGARFSRPKWGVYRGLKNKSDLKDEEVLFNDFSIEEIKLLTFEELKLKAKRKKLKADKKKNVLVFKDDKPETFDGIEIFASTGKRISTANRIKRNKIDVSGMKNGDYYLSFLHQKRNVKVVKFVIK